MIRLREIINKDEVEKNNYIDIIKEKDEKIISINEDLNRKANEIQSLIEENKKIEYNYKIEVSNLNKKNLL